MTEAGLGPAVLEPPISPESMIVTTDTQYKCRLPQTHIKNSEPTNLKIVAMCHIFFANYIVYIHPIRRHTLNLYLYECLRKIEMTHLKIVTIYVRFERLRWHINWYAAYH